MNAAKLKIKLDGQTSLAKKVYECTPAQELWSAGQICDEMRRKGQVPNKRLVEGCLNTLKDSGLVVEQGQGLFKAIVIKKKPTIFIETENDVIPFAAYQAGSEEEVEVNTVKKIETKRKTPIEILSGLATKIENVMDDLDDLKKEIEDAALEITDQMSADDDKIKQLRQLQALLKNLGE